jgi:hypothetical protein
MLNLTPKPYPTKKPYSILAYGAKSYENITPTVNYTIGYIPIKKYCEIRFITRKILKTFIRNGWVVLNKGLNTRIGVKEICTNEINDYLR